MQEAKPPATTEYSATIRIDAEPGGKKFQGVWLEFAADRRWVIDYRPRELWRGFQDAEVIVTGTCYRPFGQAISATHFKVERMRFAAPPKRSVPFFELGPEQLMKGSFVEQAAPAGSKLAGSHQLEFQADDGTTYGIAGTSGSAPAPGAAKVTARSVKLNLAYAATTGGPHLWILSVHDAAYEPDREHAPKPVPCP